MWPQLASEWSTLSESERMEGGGGTWRGVQGPNADAAVRYAIHAKKVGADAIISLTPVDEKDPKGCLRHSRILAQVCLAELTHEFVHKTRGGLTVWLPTPRPGAVERRTKGESEAP